MVKKEEVCGNIFELIRKGVFAPRMSRLMMERKSVIYSTIQSTRHVRYVLLNAYSSMCVFFPFRTGRATIRVYRGQVYRQDIFYR